MPSDDDLRRSLAHIEVTRPGSDKVGRGTGLPVGPDRVLTALHVVAGAISKVEVCFPELYGDRRYSATVIWPTNASVRRDVGDEVLDAAILQLEESPPGLKSVPLGTRVCTEHEEWWSRGFPRAAKRALTAEAKASVPEVWPYTGKVAGAPVQRANGTWGDVALHVDGEPDERDGWKGASGAPVLIGRELHGIVRSVRAEWKERLLAVSVRALVAAPGFTVAMGCHSDVDEWRRHRASWVDALASRLDGDRDILEQLSRASKLPAEPATLAKGLMGLTLTSFCGFCNVAHEHLVELGRAASAKGLYELVKELVPLVVDSALVESVVRSAEGRVVELRADTLTLAALVSAAADKQALVVRVAGPGKNTLKFPLQIDSEGEVAGKGGADAIVSELRNGLLERDVRGRLGGTSLKMEPDQVLCAYLKYQANPERVYKPYRYFYAYEPTAVGRGVAIELNRRFPLIRTFELSGAASSPDEFELTLALFDILLRGG